MRQGWLGVMIVGVAVVAAGCATLVKGGTQTVSFASNPEGATVLVAGRPIGKTPTTVTLSKKPGQDLRFEKEGYKPLSATLETRTSSWFWGNIVIGGLLGSTTDGASGAIYEYSPSQYMVSLEPMAAKNDLEAATLATERQRIKDFIVTGYRGIQTDLGAGKGDYLDSLIRMLNVPTSDVPAAKKQLRALSDLYPNVPEFADGVLARFTK